MLKLLRDVIKYRHLIIQLTSRDVSSRYQGSIIGTAWSLILPLLTLAVYAIVFGTILVSKWPHALQTESFSLVLFPGLIVFSFFFDSITRASSVISSNATYIKKVAFPAELLVLIPIGTALVNLLLGFTAWAILCLVLGHPLTLYVLYLPIILSPLILLTAGISWIVAALGVFVRDISTLLIVGAQLLLYLAPVIYPREALPLKWAWLLSLNPITIPVEQIRTILISSNTPNLLSVLLYAGVACSIAVVGSYVFGRLKDGFADII